MERLKERDDMIGLRLDGMKKFKALKLVQFFPNFLLDEFFFRVGGFIHGENMKRHLVLSVSIANECDTVATHNDLQFHLMNKHSQLSVATSAPSVCVVTGSCENDGRYYWCYWSCP